MLDRLQNFAIIVMAGTSRCRNRNSSNQRTYSMKTNQCKQRGAEGMGALGSHMQSCQSSEPAPLAIEPGEDLHAGPSGYFTIRSGDVRQEIRRYACTRSSADSHVVESRRECLHEGSRFVSIQSVNKHGWGVCTLKQRCQLRSQGEQCFMCQSCCLFENEGWRQGSGRSGFLFGHTEQ